MHIRGREQIDRVWSLSKVIPTNIAIFSYRFGTRDYRVILVDFKLNDIVVYRVKICSLEIRRIIHENKVVVEKCNIKALDLL